MTDHAELPQALVSALERLRAVTATDVRDTAYQVMLEFGVDVAKLARAEHTEIAKGWHATIEARVATRTLLQARVDAGRLPAARLAKAIERSRELDVRIRTDRMRLGRVVKDLEARAQRIEAHSAPTPERIAHHGEAAAVSDRDEEDKALAAPRHRLVWAIDRISHLLTAGEYNAAQRLREVYWQRRAYAKVSDITGSGGRGVAGSRVPVTVAMVRAGAEWAAVGRWMPLAIRGIALNFVVEEAPRGRDAPLTWVEFGRAYGGVKDDKTARGVAYGAAKTCCVLLEAAFREQDSRPVAERIEAQARARRG